MNAGVLMNAGIDYERGVKRFVGRAPLYEKTLIRFTRDTTFERIKAAYESGDMNALFANAHEFKGMCGNIAMACLYEASDALVNALRSGERQKADVASLFAALEAEYRRAISAIKTAMEETV